MTLISKVGGARGPSLEPSSCRPVLRRKERASFRRANSDPCLEKGLAGVISRGKAAIGDKTMVDALQPAIKAYRRFGRLR